MAVALPSVTGDCPTLLLHTTDSGKWRLPSADNICRRRLFFPSRLRSRKREEPRNGTFLEGFTRLRTSKSWGTSPGLLCWCHAIPHLCSSRSNRRMHGSAAGAISKCSRNHSKFGLRDVNGFANWTEKFMPLARTKFRFTPKQQFRSADDANAFNFALFRVLGVEWPLKLKAGWWRGDLLRALAYAGGIVVFGAVLQSPCSVAASLSDSSITATISDLPPIPSQFQPLPDIKPLSYEKLTLSNGLRVFLLEDHELGLVGGELLVNGGSKFEPPNKAGLAKLTAAVQRSGGTAAHPAEDLDSKLDVMAARIEASASVSEMNVGFRCLAEDLPAVMSLFSEVVREPLMPESKLELTRSQYIGAIARRPDDAGGIVAREFNKILYGKESLYSRVAEIQTIRAIDREDLLTFHKNNFRPDKGVLGIWGDFSTPAMKEMVEQSFGNWRPSPEKVASLSGGTTGRSALETGCSATPPSVYLINRPGLTQGYVRMGEFGTTLADPDVFALDVLNEILNGFGGLLFDEVRSREGLAYSVSGGWSPAVEHRGAFIAGGETRVQAIPQFVGAVKRVLSNVISDPPDAELLARAKEKALNSFVFNFADSGAQLARVLSYTLFGIDQDFLFKYKAAVEATTALDVLEAAQRHLHPDSQPVLIVTDTQQLPSLVSAFGQPVVQLDIDYLSQRDSVSKK